MGEATFARRTPTGQVRAPPPDLAILLVSSPRSCPQAGGIPPARSAREEPVPLALAGTLALLGVALESIRLYVLPLILVSVGILQALFEMRSFRAEADPDRHRRVRLGRRLATSLILITVGLMLHSGGDLAPSAGNPDEAVRQFYYWVTVLGLVLVVGGLALWDALDSLRGLAHHIEHIEKAELDSLREQLKKDLHHRKKR